MADVFEINCTTGEVIERDFTAKEKTQRNKDIAAAEKATAEEEQRKAARKAKITELKKDPKIADVLDLLGVSE